MSLSLLLLREEWVRTRLPPAPPERLAGTLPVSPIAGLAIGGGRGGGSLRDCAFWVRRLNYLIRRSRQRTHDYPQSRIINYKYAVADTLIH